MKIWIDGKEANVLNRVGSGQYAFELLRNLEKIDPKNEYTILLPSKPKDDLPKPRLNWKYKILRPSRAWTRFAIPAALYLSKNKPDLIFTPSHYIPRFSPVKRVCTIFDLSYLHFPEMFKVRDLWQLKNWTRFSIDNADHLFAISDFTKKDIVKKYDVSPDNITVTPLGFDKNIFKPINDKAKIYKVLSKYKIDPEKPYIIYIGTIQPRKNLLKLIEAFRYVILGSKATPESSKIGSWTSQDDKDLKLVIVGKTNEAGRQGWKFKEILEAPKKLGIKDKVIFTGFVPSDELPYLLAGAKLFVLPSLWEGFGIPVLEAMATGTAVLISNVSSLPEVGGDGATYIDPDSVESLRKGLNSLLTDDKLRENKVQLGLKQAQKFSWGKTAKKTLEMLESLK